jgi:hypothetical protein
LLLLLLFLVEVIIEILVPDGIKTGKKHEYTKKRRRKLVHQFLNRNRTPLLKRKIENKKKRKEREEERETQSVISIQYPTAHLRWMTNYIREH